MESHPDDLQIVYSFQENLHSGIEDKINSEFSNFANIWLLELSLDKFVSLEIFLICHCIFARCSRLLIFSENVAQIVCVFC